MSQITLRRKVDDRLLEALNAGFEQERHADPGSGVRDSNVIPNEVVPVDAQFILRPGPNGTLTIESQSVPAEAEAVTDAAPATDQPGDKAAGE